MRRMSIKHTTIGSHGWSEASNSPNGRRKVSMCFNFQLQDGTTMQVCNEMFSSTPGSIYTLWKRDTMDVHHLYNTLPHTDYCIIKSHYSQMLSNIRAISKYLLHYISYNHYLEYLLTWIIKCMTMERPCPMSVHVFAALS